ncbi:hypothetical protein M413DRAFT_32281 [Hebeloma cylindrosporum]|uniref:SMC hinge domain-containing protein n=1 Tax=Hebeloma cylindrosporum TaxID=76867 RepID=A0A0C2Y3R7_HEBCY|nr:hypothetical protein M413DRAFT_32281 [Hebeloma cylindrosporum h7]
MDKCHNSINEARSEVQEAVNQHLEAESELSELRSRMKALAVERDVALKEEQQSRDLLQETRAQHSEVQHLDHQEIHQLQRQLKALEEERDEALKLVRDLQEAQSAKPFAWGAPSVPWPVDQGHAEALSDQKEKWCEELESEAEVLRSELGKVHLYSQVWSQYNVFVREVLMIAHALEGVEASIICDTCFSCEDFSTIIRSLTDGSTEAMERISDMDPGQFKVVGFIEPDEFGGWRSPSASPKQLNSPRRKA